MQIFDVLLAFVEVVALAPYFFVQLKRAGFPTASPACTFRSSPVPGMKPVESDRVSAIECMGWPRIVGFANGFQESQGQDLLTLLMAFTFNDNFAVIEVIA